MTEEARAAAALVIALCTSPVCFAQRIGDMRSTDSIIDQNITARTTVSEACDFSSRPTAEDCIKRILPSLLSKASFYVAQQSTMLVQVRYITQGNAPSTGTAFLVDKKKALFLTARHVVIGNLVWSTIIEPNHKFADLDSAIENYLRSPAVEVVLRPDSYGNAIAARIVALDRESDLALLQVKSPATLPTYNYPALFREIPFARGFECEGDVSAIGYSDAVNAGEFALSSTKFAPALCDFSPKAYFIGSNLYNFSLYSTEAGFKPGFSGGPVLNQYWELVGVVSGATIGVGGQTNFFVPLSQVQAFLSRFR